MQRFANPTVFLRLQKAVQPFVSLMALALLATGLYLALVKAPADALQGETARIMFIHVPAASAALFIYVLMAIASATGFIFHHPLADVSAKTAAPIGAAFTFLALFTGALWGKPMWGTWWVWDARLTSMFVLFLLYIGYMAVWQAIDDFQHAARIAGIVAIVGSINVPIIKFSVDWWNTLHQPASLLRKGGPSMGAEFLVPLAVMGLGYIMLFVALHLAAMRAELMARRIRQMQIAQAQNS